MDDRKIRFNEIDKLEFVAEVYIMVSQKIKEYEAEHSICSEYLFRDWEPFLNLVYAEGGRVQSILWWDYCKKEEQRLSVWSGGYTDPDNPTYMYAETQFFEDGLESKTLQQIIEYIKNVKASGLRYGDKYVSHELVPSFFIDEWQILLILVKAVFDIFIKNYFRKKGNFNKPTYCRFFQKV